MSHILPPSHKPPASPCLVLGIESSCDETAAAVVARQADGSNLVLSNIVLSQSGHEMFGGVVPEIAARAHVEAVDHVVAAAMREAGLKFNELSAVAATAGPGLVGGVLVGLLTGKAIALAHDLPFIPVNHLEGHALSPRLMAECPFPYLLLLTSGGHCQILLVKALGDYQRLGTTLDDAAGEAFDKAARLLDLGFPGGPAIEAAALRGQPGRFQLAAPLIGKPGLDFSFSGLKTVMSRLVTQHQPPGQAMDEQTRCDLALAFQSAIVEHLISRCERALAMLPPDHAGERRLVVAGGVAANKTLRAGLDDLAARHGARCIAPPMKFCTDNAAMIALAGLEHFCARPSDFAPGTHLDAAARPRWPLDALAAREDPRHETGQKGAKA